MTAIAVATKRTFQERGFATYPVNAAAHIYEGALVCVQLSDGMLVDGTAAAGLVFAGIAMQQVDGGSADGNVTVDVWQRGVVTLPATGGAATDVGKVAYLVDNNTVAVASQTGNIAVGRVVKFNAETSLDVDITGYAGQTAVPRVYFGTGAFSATDTTVAVTAGGLTTLLGGFVTPVIDAGAAAANGQLGFTEAGTSNLPEIGSGNVTVNRIAGTDSALGFCYVLWGN